MTQSNEIYKEGIRWINHLVTDYTDEMRKIISSTTAHDGTYASQKAMREIIQSEIKNQNMAFIDAISQLGAAEASTSLRRRGERRLNASGAKQELKEKEAQLADLEAKLAASKNDEEKEEYRAEIAALKKQIAKLKENRYSVSDGVEDAAKIAQSIFFLGSIFQSKDQEPLPNIQDDDSAIRTAKQKTAMNIAIIVSVVVVVSVAVILLLRRGRSESK